jgi:hypothetical protein
MVTTCGRVSLRKGRVRPGPLERLEKIRDQGVDDEADEATWTMTAARVTRLQRKPSQMAAPKTAGSEMKYLNRSSRLPMNRAVPTPPMQGHADRRAPDR